MLLVPRQNRLFPVFQTVNRPDHVVRRPAHAPTSVPVSVWQDEQNFFVEVDVPGVAESDVDVTVHQGQLFIRGERKREEGRKYLYNGRGYGRFERSVTLPEDVVNDAVNAELINGVLRVTLPKRPEAQPKRITVQAN